MTSLPTSARSVHGQGRHLVARQGRHPRGRHLHHERRVHRRHPCPGRAHDHARLPLRGLVAFVQNSAHWSDAGGPVPGSFHAEARRPTARRSTSRRCTSSGQGVLDDELMRFILRNVRVPETTQGDCSRRSPRADRRARPAGAHRQVRRELIRARDGRADPLLGGAPARGVRRLPDGTYSFEDAIDFDPAGDRTTPIDVRVEISIVATARRYDLSRSDPQARGAVNMARSMAQSAVVVATKAVFPHVPANEGIYNAIEIVNPPGRITNAQFPAPVSGAFATAYEVTQQCIFGCYLQMRRTLDGMLGNQLNLVVGGYDPRPGFGSDFVMYMWKEGGYGARPGRRTTTARSASTPRGHGTSPSRCRSGSTRFSPTGTSSSPTPPVLVATAAGSAWRVTSRSPTARRCSRCSGAARPKPSGGGKAGFRRSAADSSTTGVASTSRTRRHALGVAIRKEAVIRYWEGGGGGWQDPKTRPQEWVLEDVVDELVSVEAAHDVYGVAVRCVDEDAAATRSMRPRRQGFAPGRAPEPCPDGAGSGTLAGLIERERTLFEERTPHRAGSPRGPSARSSEAYRCTG